MGRLNRFFESNIPLFAGYLLTRGIVTNNKEMWISALVIELSSLGVILTQHFIKQKDKTV